MLKPSVLLALLLTACAYDQPDPIGGDDDDVPPPPPGQCEAGGCALLASSPEIASAGDTITLEGTFGSAVTVDFPGAPGIAATVLGAHRATAIVPPGATVGPLSVTSGGERTGSVPFRRASFQLGLQQFQRFDDQSNGARPMSALVIPRRYMQTATVGRFVYVFSGIAAGVRDDIERAPILADGSLGPFAIVPGAKVTTPRFYGQAVTLGGFVYLIGGVTTGDVEIDKAHSVERAPILPDGSLGTFAVVPDVTLVEPRHVHQVAVVGNTLYVSGGANNTSFLTSVERATIAPDGTLGPFTMDSRSLPAPRVAAHSLVTRGYWYLIGGQTDGAVAVDTIERAPIAADGTLGAFESVATKLATARNSASAVVLGNSLYIAGGNSAANAPLASVERASIADDGTLGSFGAMPGVVLPTPISAAASASTGNFMHVIGGWNGSANTAGIVRASINASGLLDTTIVDSPAFVGPPISLYPGNVVGGAFYVLGGSFANGDGQRVQRLDLAGDGAVGAFADTGARLAEPLMRHTSAVIGDFVYVFGGANTGNAATTDIERAPLSSDGTPGAFAKLTTTRLASGRCSHATVVAGKFVYTLGGFYGGNATTVERAAINADGTILPFAIVPGVTLTTAHTDVTAAVIGNFLYVFGGRDASEASSLTTIERAPLDADGALVGGFTASNAFVHARAYTQIAVLGSFVYAIGGDAGGTVERASIQPDGSLAAFSVVPGLTASGTSGVGAVSGNVLVSCGAEGCAQMSLR